MLAVNYMKKCLYCGRINAASALSCAGCGASEFEPLRPTYYPSPQPVPNPLSPASYPPVAQISPAIRFLYFFFVGLLVIFYWLVFATLFLLTIVAQPLAMAMYRSVPAVATLSRTPPPFGVVMTEGWRETVRRYRAAPVWGKVLAPLVFVGCLVALVVLSRS